jgi:hypothetical protein
MPEHQNLPQLQASRVDAIEPFRVMEMVKQAAAMSRAGIDVISMSVGEPDFTAPEMVAQAAVDAIRGGATQYTESLGLPACAKRSPDIIRASTASTSIRAASWSPPAPRPACCWPAPRWWPRATKS